jgi:hypothetical protein
MFRVLHAQARVFGAMGYGKRMRERFKDTSVEIVDTDSVSKTRLRKEGDFNS